MTVGDIYGYLNRVRSSRRLEAEIHLNIEVIWLLRQPGPIPALLRGRSLIHPRAPASYGSVQ